MGEMLAAAIAVPGRFQRGPLPSNCGFEDRLQQRHPLASATAFRDAQMSSLSNRRTEHAADRANSFGRVLPSRYPAAVTKKIVPAFSIATVESVAKAVGDLYSGSELTRMLAEVRLKDALGEGMTKWKRPRRRDGQSAGPPGRRPTGGRAHQRCDGTRQDAVSPCCRVYCPRQTQPRAVVVRLPRDRSGEGRDHNPHDHRERGGSAERTGPHTLLSERGGHSHVLGDRRPELLRTDFYEAVFESIKGLGHRLRAMGGKDEDGPRLVESVLEGTDPMLLLNDRANQSQRDEQRGVALLNEGTVCGLQEPPGAMSLGSCGRCPSRTRSTCSATFLMIHRRLDGAKPRT